MSMPDRMTKLTERRSVLIMQRSQAKDLQEQAERELATIQFAIQTLAEYMEDVEAEIATEVPTEGVIED